MVSNMFDHRPNEQNVLQCLIKCLSSLKLYHTRSNAIKHGQSRFPNDKMFGNRTIFDRVLCQFYRQTFPIVAVDIKSFSIYVFFFFTFFFPLRSERTMPFEPNASCVTLLHSWVVELNTN